MFEVQHDPPEINAALQACSEMVVTSMSRQETTSAVKSPASVCICICTVYIYMCVCVYIRKPSASGDAPQVLFLLIFSFVGSELKLVSVPHPQPLHQIAAPGSLGREAMKAGGHFGFVAFQTSTASSEVCRHGIVWLSQAVACWPR